MKKPRLVINHIQRKRLKIIARRFKLKLILAFGSEITGKVHHLSDLDIAVLRNDNNSFSWNSYSNLIHNLEKVFPEKKIDLVFIDRADPLLLNEISRTFICLSGSKRTLAEFLILAFKRYQDYRPFFRLEEKCVTNFIMGG